MHLALAPQEISSWIWNPISVSWLQFPILHCGHLSTPAPLWTAPTLACDLLGTPILSPDWVLNLNSSLLPGIGPPAQLPPGLASISSLFYRSLGRIPLYYPIPGYSVQGSVFTYPEAELAMSPKAPLHEGESQWLLPFFIYMYSSIHATLAGASSRISYALLHTHELDHLITGGGLCIIPNCRRRVPSFPVAANDITTLAAHGAGAFNSQPCCCILALKINGSLLTVLLPRWFFQFNFLNLQQHGSCLNVFLPSCSELFVLLHILLIWFSALSLYNNQFSLPKLSPLYAWVMILIMRYLSPSFGFCQVSICGLRDFPHAFGHILYSTAPPVLVKMYICIIFLTFDMGFGLSLGLHTRRALTHLKLALL